jgi:hypothetical protein
MAFLHETPIQPLDVILFRGVDPVSRAICFFEEKRLGRGDFSHIGLAITRDALDLPFLEPGKVYVWESTLSAPAGFFARFTDKVPDRETEGVRFGVQIRDLELVVPAYASSGGKVAWSRFLGQRPPMRVLRERLTALHEEFGHVAYTHNLFALFSVVYPGLRPARDAFSRAEDRLAHFVGHVLRRAREDAHVDHPEHHMFCSEWVGTVFSHLGLARPEFDAHLAAPVTPLLRPEGFAAPVYLEVPDAGASRS